MQHNTKSNSVGQISNNFKWVLENYHFFILRIKNLRDQNIIAQKTIFEIINYNNLFKKYTGKELTEARILEIGYGARPNRLITFMSMGYNAKGIDIDVPLLNLKLSTIISIYKHNGFKRALKSTIRSLLFDKHERNALAKALAEHNFPILIDESKFIVADATNYNFENESIDFIYSEDVFEHIEENGLHNLCKKIQSILNHKGIAYISILTYPSLRGGHSLDWYNDNIKFNDAEPWEHLRQNRYPVDCFLNKLSIHDYTNIFCKYFKILDRINCSPKFGIKFLTDDIQNELNNYDHEELISDKWVFILQR